MNLKKVDFKEDLKYIQDNGLDKYLAMLVYGEKIADAASPDGDARLRRYRKEHGVTPEAICGAVDTTLSKDRLNEVINKFSDYGDSPESLDDTVVDTVKHCGYTWEQALDILDVLLTTDEKYDVIMALSM